jgi:hypothetical protein
MLLPGDHTFASSGIVPNCTASTAATASVNGRDLAMKHYIRTFLFSLAIPVAFAAAAFAPGNANAQRGCQPGDVCPGYDLFETVQPTNFQGIQFEGLPLGTFDFGPSGGPADPTNVGNTSTIVQRLGTVEPPGGTTDLVMLALQLISVGTFDTNLVPDLGEEKIYVTLNESVPSTGSMTIDIDNPLALTNNGTFSSTLNVAFDLTWGSPDGLNLNSVVGCVGPCVMQLTSTDVPWSRIASGALQIEGVNFLLDGEDVFGDFWPGVHGDPPIIDEFTEIHSGNGEHTVQVTVPEPGTMTLLGAGLFGLWRCAGGCPVAQPDVGFLAMR